MNEAAALAERLRKSVEDALSGERSITISLGIACTTQAAFETAEKLFEAADAALYKAKQAGRNRVGEFEERRGQQGTAGLAAAE